jgi:hypothetical protein
MKASNDNFVKCNINLSVDFESMLENEDTFQRNLYALEHIVQTVLAQSSTGEHKCMNMSVLYLSTSNFHIPLFSPTVSAAE